MDTRQLGRSDLLVSRVIMGCWAIVGDATWGPQDEQDAIDALRVAMDCGMTTFDTAEAYGGGESERLLARALGSNRDKATILTKVSPSHLAPEELTAACERSLTNLNTDHIDLYQIHWPNHELPIDDVMRRMEKLRDQGKVRVLGVSNFGPRDLSELLEVGRVESNQLVYSLLTRAIEFDILPQCREHEVGVLCYSPLAQGLLTGKFASVDDVPLGRRRTRHFAGHHELTRHGQPGCEAETFAAIDAIRSIAAELNQPMATVSLAWLLAQPGVTAVIAGARNVPQVEQNAAAAALSLDADVVTRLASVTDAVKQALGPDADAWQAESRIR